MNAKTLNSRTQHETMDLLELLADTTHPTKRDDWALMLEVIARVGTAHNGLVSMNDIRPGVRGIIEPHAIGSLVRKAKHPKRCIIVTSGADKRKGSFSGDNGRWQDRYALGNFHNWCVEYAKASNHGTDVEWARAEAITRGWAAEGWNSEDQWCTDWKVYLPA